MRHEEDGMDAVLRAALEAHTARAVPGPSAAVRERVRAGLEPRARRRPRGRRLVLGIVAVAVALALATGVAIAAGVLNQPIVQVPADVFRQHFQEQHHGTAGKGTTGPGTQTGSVDEAGRRAGFRVRTLRGVDGAELTQVTVSSVTFRDGSREPEVEVDYRVGDVTVSATQAKDPQPNAPFEVPSLAPNMRVQTIDGAQYLFILDATGAVRAVQYKTADGIVLSVNFFGPPYPGTTGPGGADPNFAEDVIRHLG